jgi:sirohydrochlorin ferrochelatase
MKMPDFDWSSLPCERSELGIVIVDHGSRRAQSNEMLPMVVDMYRQTCPFEIVEPAHMELALPSIADAFARCVEQGAKLVVVHPYFLLPGRHWDQDIPRLAAEAASQHAGLQFLVTSPLSLHPLMAQVIQSRIEQCLEHALGKGESCSLCEATDKCQLRPGSDGDPK